MSKARQIMSEVTGKQKYQGSFNWHGENIQLFKYAGSEAQARLLMLKDLAKKVGYNEGTIFGMYSNNKDLYRIKKID